MADSPFQEEPRQPRQSRRPGTLAGEDLYRSLFENSYSVMLIIDPETAAIVDANVAACRFYGFEREEILRKSITEINTLSPQQVHEEMQRARQEERNFFHFRHEVKNGAIKDVEVYSGPITIEGKAYLYSIVHDITDRKRIEAALRESEKLLADVFESLQDGLSVLSTDLTVQRVNRKMNQWYAQNAPLEGKKCYACYHNADEPCRPCPSLRCISSGKTERDIVPGLPGSTAQWLELFSYPIQEKETGEVVGVAEFVRDITEQKKLEASLYQAQKMEAIGTLAGGIAHDFNNLLMGIQGRASLILSSLPPDDPNVEHAVGIEKYVKSATDLTRQLLGFARGGKYETVPTDMNEILRQSAKMFGRTKKEIQIHQDLEANLWTVEVDRRQMEQVLLNLYVNAWQAMPGGGELRLQTENVTLNEWDMPQYRMEPGRYIKITVTDTGVGMAETTQRRVFEPFFTTKEMGRGTGLGLASAYGIVKNHNGFIHVFSQRGCGSTFAVFLPASEKSPRREERPLTEAVSGSGTVLLVDDEKIMLEVAGPMLERLGYRVLSARGGSEALDLFQREKDRIDLVVLDLIMPGMGGGETFDRMKELNPDVNVLLASGYSIDSQAAGILERGCRGFIQKPFTIDQLSAKIRHILQPAQATGKET